MIEPTQIPQVLASSYVGATDRKGYVSLQWGTMHGKMTPAEARQFAVTIMQVAEAADLDEKILQHTGTFKEGVQLMRIVREIRETPITDPNAGRKN